MIKHSISKIKAIGMNENTYNSKRRKRLQASEKDYKHQQLHAPPCDLMLKCSGDTKRETRGKYAHRIPTEHQRNHKLQTSQNSTTKGKK